jgi:hypothetical protein
MILNNGDFRVLAQELSPVSKAQRGENTRGVSSEAGRRPPSASASLSRQDPSPSGVGGDKSIARYTMIYLDKILSASLRRHRNVGATIPNLA